MRQKWTQEEIGIIKNNKNATSEELKLLLPGRDVLSIKSKKVRLGVKPEKEFIWRKEEVEILINNRDKSHSELAELLPNRTMKGIRGKRWGMGIKTKNRWTQDEMNLLIENKNESTHQLKTLLPNRTAKSIDKKLCKLGVKRPRIINLGIKRSGITSKKSWTKEEMSVLESNQEKSAIELSKMIPTRSLAGIKSRRSNLGIKSRENKKWSPEEDAIIIDLASETYCKELKEILPGRSVESIQNRCKRLKIRKTDEFVSAHGKRFIGQADRILPRRYKLDQGFTIEDLDNITYQVLIGGMLGDGGVSLNCNVYTYSETHCVAQKNYLIWKKKLLSKFQPQNIHCEYTAPALSTPSHPIFKKIREEMYLEGDEFEDGRKAYMPLNYIQRLDELGLFIWYLDDGNNGAEPTICSAGLTLENLKDAIDIINKKFNLSLYVRSKNYKGKDWYLPVKNIVINKENREKLWPIWINLAKNLDLPECMRYKLIRKGFNPFLIEN